ncbi:hypothetical protein APHWI1_0507 [Anaplasma phagocytophilum str. ApWI1]|uniref:Uncharacterized protein n=2 Tax=Anaplasma phagocytophilum TaxID=948 RepID=A0A0F3N5E0_ANAPH|nr:hypothetical protein APHWEB_1004 [Anaplasma phagocytophilum str. Webster]KJV62902.1 hypothetical protein EPHNCH_1324 [Anaplasma phagocytophilum str. NCH-1]KJV82578.1 hypothetical protein APHHGE2_1305 [Anaplasma phagocytophilum str. HGE2]KJV85321.1 hypothetical protein APHWI1_0507 [Anaplasma phagocytophilum str. ApWI1]KJV86810.1 hypothetical protein APHNYW_1019 [Anaplasma phagocytophilum str. ApNYW]KJV98275.1 hypothetical protein OTSANNIE_1276 [Anaplasma phagocytophilum str. Annie]
MKQAIHPIDKSCSLLQSEKSAMRVLLKLPKLTVHHVR